jgi:hypothetical protein
MGFGIIPLISGGVYGYQDAKEGKVSFMEGWQSVAKKNLALLTPLYGVTGTALGFTIAKAKGAPPKDRLLIALAGGLAGVVNGALEAPINSLIGYSIGRGIGNLTKREEG